MLAFRSTCAFSPAGVLRGGPGSNSVFFDRLLASRARTACLESLAKCRIVFRVKLSRLVQSAAKSRSKFLLCSALGYHRDGLRSVLYNPPAVQEVSRDIQPVVTNTVAGFFRQLWKLLLAALEVLKIVFRSLEMCVLVSPLVLTAPLVLKIERFQDVWFKLLVTTVEACGPVYVKLGQWASTRRDIFPPKLCFHLSKLQRQAQTHPWDFTEKTLNESFGSARVSGHLPYINHEPVGSGCVAQVYIGMLDITQLSLQTRKQLEVRVRRNFADGRDFGHQIPVAIKVLHPNITKNFSRDLSVLKLLVAFVSRLFPSLEWLSLRESIDEFASLMEVQIDLTHEAENLLQFGQDFSRDARIVFPVPILELCHPNVIVETFESGLPLSSVVNRLDEMSVDARRAVANAGVEMLLKMVFRNNFVHGDLHPGNLMVRGLDQDSLQLTDLDKSAVQLIILDPGIVASLTQKDLSNFKAVFSAVARKDGKRVGELFLEQSHNECLQETLFVAEIESIVRDAMSHQISLAKLDVANLLSRVFSTLRSHRVKLDPNFTSVILAIIVLEGLGRSLDPDLDLLWKATPYLIRS